MVLLRRREGMDRAQFDAGWQRASALVAAGLPGLVRQVRNEIVSEVRRDHMTASEQSLDAIEEFWFRDACARDEALEAWRSTPFPIPATACLLAVSGWLAFQRLPPEQEPLKRLSLLIRKKGMTREAFTRYWQSVHAPLASCHRYVQTYVQNHVTAAIPLSTDGELLMADGIGEFLISDLERMQEDYRSEAGIRMKQDVKNFVASARTYLVHAREVAYTPVL